MLAHAEDVGGPAADVMPEMRDSIPAREGPPAPAPGGGESVIHLAPQSAAPIPFGESAQLPPQPETSITGPSPAQPLPPGRKAGEVTRIFRAWADESRADRRERVEPPSQPISPEVPAEPTRSFHPAESDGASMVPPLHAQTSHPPPERPLAPGEFTSIFGGAPTSSLAEAGPNRSEVAMPSFSPVREPGEFTRLFQGMSDGVQAPGPNQPQVELPAPGAPQEPGEFTRMFHSQGNLSSTPPDGVRRGPIIEPTPQPAPSPNGPGEFTRLFGSPHPVSKGSQQGGGQALQPPPASGASQVLKMPPSVPVSVQKRQAPKLVAPAAVPMPNVAPPKVDVQFPQVPKSGPSPLLLIVILGALSLAAIGMVLLFLLKH